MPKTKATRYRDPLRAVRTPEETCRLFGVGIDMIREMAEKKIVDAIMAGNRMLITVASIERQLGKPIEELEAPLRAGSSESERVSIAV
jgi:hypothetical protein